MLSWSVQKIKAALRESNLHTYGLRADLLYRLLKHMKEETSVKYQEEEVGKVAKVLEQDGEGRKNLQEEVATAVEKDRSSELAEATISSVKPRKNQGLEEEDPCRMEEQKDTTAQTQEDEDAVTLSNERKQKVDDIKSKFIWLREEVSLMEEQRSGVLKTFRQEQEKLSILSMKCETVKLELVKQESEVQKMKSKVPEDEWQDLISDVNEVCDDLEDFRGAFKVGFTNVITLCKISFAGPLV